MSEHRVRTPLERLVGALVGWCLDNKLIVLLLTVLVIGWDGPWLLALPMTSQDHDRDARQQALATWWALDDSVRTARIAAGGDEIDLLRD